MHDATMVLAPAFSATLALAFALAFDLPLAFAATLAATLAFVFIRGGGESLNEELAWGASTRFGDMPWSQHP